MLKKQCEWGFKNMTDISQEGMMKKCKFTIWIIYLLKFSNWANLIKCVLFAVD